MVHKRINYGGIVPIVLVGLYLLNKWTKVVDNGGRLVLGGVVVDYFGSGLSGAQLDTGDASFSLGEPL